MKKFLPKFNIPLSTLLIGGLILFWVLVQSFNTLHRPRLTTDFVSFALSSSAPLLKIGMPYTDFWGINPPGLLLMLGSWALLFGTSLRSFHFLYVLSLAVIGALTWITLKKVFSASVAAVLFIFWGILFFSNTVQSQFFPSEIHGLLLTLIGLRIVFQTKLSGAQIGWASFLFIMAGQMKEVYAPIIFMLLPHFLVVVHQGAQKTFRFIAHALFGLLAAIVVLLGYLVVTSSVHEYFEITAYKSEQFAISDVGLIFSRFVSALQFPIDLLLYPKYPFILVLILSLGSLFFWLSSNVTSQLKKNTLQLQLILSTTSFFHLLGVVYFLSSLLGYAVQNRYGNKYEIPIILPTLIMIGLSANIVTSAVFTPVKWFSNQRIDILQKIVLFCLVLLLAFPKKSFFAEQLAFVKSYHPVQHVRLWMNAEHPEFLKMEMKIQANTASTDCITKVYGWGVGDAYLYSQRPSCSKHFLVNLLPANQRSHYAEEIITNAPKAIIYTTEATDLNFQAFETTVYNFPLILKECYEQDKDLPQLFWPRFQGQELTACLRLGVPG